jgi:hypothetical protein
MNHTGVGLTVIPERTESTGAKGDVMSQSGTEETSVLIPPLKKKKRWFEVV